MWIIRLIKTWQTSVQIAYPAFFQSRTICKCAARSKVIVRPLTADRLRVAPVSPMGAYLVRHFLAAIVNGHVAMAGLLQQVHVSRRNQLCRQQADGPQAGA